MTSLSERISKKVTDPKFCLVDLDVDKKQKEVSNKRDLYDEDGVRVVYDNGPSESVKANRSGWKALPLNEKVRWTQTSTEILTWIKVPKGNIKCSSRLLKMPSRYQGKTFGSFD